MHDPSLHPPALNEIYRRVVEDDKLLYQDIGELYAYITTISSPWRPITRYPSLKRYKLPQSIQQLNLTPDNAEPLPHTPVIELMGLPDSGKSLLCEHLHTAFPDSNIQDESYEIEDLPPNSYLQLLNLLIASRKRLSASSSMLNLFREQKNRLTLPPGSDKNPYPLQIFSRGPNDILAFSIPLYFTLSEPIVNADPIIREILHDAVVQLSMIDAIILFDNDLEIARLRRVQQGKKRDGTIVNDRIWPIISEGYSWWLEYIYPLLRERFGTGLIVVDGRQPYKKNNLRVVKYLRKIQRRIPEQIVIH